MSRIFLICLVISSLAFGRVHFGVGGGLEVKNNIRKDNLVDGLKNRTIYRYFPTGSLFAGRFYLVDKRALLTIYNSKLLKFRLFTDYAGEEYLGAGMKHRRRSLYGGASLSFVLLHLSFASDLLGRSNGTRYMIATGLAVRIGEFGHLSWRIGRQFYSEDYTNYYFGVSASEAVVGRPEYSTSSVGNYQVTITYQYRVFTHLSLAMAVSYKKFGDEIKNSPTVSEFEQYSTLIWGTLTF